MAGIWDRLKTWLDDETLTNSDLNAEFDNVQANAIASETEGYSSINNVPNNELMDTTLAPYPNQVRNYATSVGDEIAQLRYQILQMLGSNADEWYDAPISDLSQLASSVAGFLPTSQNAILSGPTSATGQPMHLVPSGTTNSLTLNCSAVDPFVAKINGNTYSFTSPITITGLSTAPTSGNTGLVDSDSQGNAFSANKTAGESWIGLADPSSLQYQEYLPLNTVGSNIVAKQGTQIAFLMNGEYSIGTPVPGFLGVAATPVLTTVYTTSGVLMQGCKRGYFFDSTGNILPRVGTATGNTLTLLVLTYIFLRTSGSLNATYNKPSVAGVAPVSPNQGDYWYDTVNATWKIYAGSGWVVDNSIFVGVCCQSSTATKGARSADYLASYADTNSMEVGNNFNSTAQIKGSHGARVSIYGRQVYFETSGAVWDITANLVAGVTLTSGMQLFMYMDQYGNPFIDNVQPYNRPDLAGYYHPANPWRCLGTASTDGTNFKLDCFDYIIPPFKKNRTVRLRWFNSGATSNYFGPIMKFYSRGKRLKISLEDPSVGILCTTGYPSAAYFANYIQVNYATQAQINASASPIAVGGTPALLSANGGTTFNGSAGGLPVLLDMGYAGLSQVVPDPSLGLFNPGTGDFLLQVFCAAPSLPGGMSLHFASVTMRVEELD